MRHPDRPRATARPPVALTGRHKAPTGAPRSTNVRMGGEGTPSREVNACLVVPPATAEAVRASAGGAASTGSVPLASRMTPRHLFTLFCAPAGLWVRACGRDMHRTLPASFDACLVRRV